MVSQRASEPPDVGEIPISLQVACEMIPMPSMSALYQFLNKNKQIFPMRYRRTSVGAGSPRGYRQRMLLPSEIRLIRKMTVIEKEHSVSALGAIMRRALS